MNYPSIFNDVLGPVMRGPSSSHCAAALRIGRICNNLVGGRLSEVLIEYDPKGSLATTHKDQGSDMGLFGGLLGWEAHDERLVNAEQHLAAAGIAVRIEIVLRPVPAPAALSRARARASRRPRSSRARKPAAGSRSR